jgi:mycofactocin biosynthetic radical S-adenosylmethionine protein MftC
MAAKFFTGLPLDGPDPECVQGYGAEALAGADQPTPPRPALDHSHRGPVRGQAGPGRGQAGPGRPVPVTIGPRPPGRECDQDPLARG